MALPCPQNPLDWTTQAWNILKGRRFSATENPWLIGPVGSVGEISDKVAQKIATEENLSVCRSPDSTGLMESFNAFSLPHPVNPRIEHFYTSTLEYELQVWTQWSHVFGSFGWLVRQLFSKRIQQLNLPQRSLESARGLHSELILLKDIDGVIRYRIWFRRLKSSNQVVYSGIYSHCVIPNGESCIKVVFPLPHGNATVIMSARSDEKGNLTLESRGQKFGDPGFYFIVFDRKGYGWVNYLRSFHEKIFVFEDEYGDLRADHSMSLWGFKAYELHYKMDIKSDRADAPHCLNSQ